LNFHSKPIDMTSTVRFLYRFPAHGSCHGMSRRMQALSAIAAVFGAAIQGRLEPFCVLAVWWLVLECQTA